jgi:hypothetical protein
VKLRELVKQRRLIEDNSEGRDHENLDREDDDGAANTSHDEQQQN